MVIAAGKTYTAEDYLALEVASETRSEYRAGEIVPMTGGTPEHSEIITTLIFLLKSALRGRLYAIFAADQRLWIPDKDIYTYPDVMVVPRPVALKPGRRDTVMNPALIAEVLSDSTQAYDRGDKFQAYRTIPALQEYLLIDQGKPCVEQYVKQDKGQWLLTECLGLEARVILSSVPVEIDLAELYKVLEDEGDR
ncbi:MAG: Uma2 family endonuclease [Elainellaceae cyanobacterium]